MNIFSDYDSFIKSFPASGALAAFRQAGQDYALQKGLPTRKDEEWHYTSVKAVNDVQFSSKLGGTSPISPELTAQITTHLNPQFTNVVFVNGLLEKSLTDDLPFGFTLKDDFDFPTKFDDAFDAVNGAYTNGPLNISLAKETSVEKPVNFLFFTTQSSGMPQMCHPRIKIYIGARSSVKILESYYGSQTSKYLVNSVVELNVAESAKVTYARIQADAESAFNIGRTRINVEKNATLETMAFSVGAQLSRHTLEVALKGQGSTSGIFGVYATRGTQHADNTTLIDHQVGECSAEQLYKGILDNESRAVFSGKV
jgi:Fe-S cluster assembly protein SufD